MADGRETPLIGAVHYGRQGGSWKKNPQPRPQQAPRPRPPTRPPLQRCKIWRRPRENQKLPPPPLRMKKCEFRGDKVHVLQKTLIFGSAAPHVLHSAGISYRFAPSPAF